MLNRIFQFFRDATAVKPPLFMALEKQDKKWVRALIKQGAAVNEVYCGKTPLMAALDNFPHEQDRRDVVTWLLAKGAKPALAPEGPHGNAFISALHDDTVLALFQDHSVNEEKDPNKTKLKQLVV